MGKKILLLLFNLYYALVFGGYFTIIGPRTVEQGENYKVFLTSGYYYDGDEQMSELEVSLTGQGNQEEIEADGGSKIALYGLNKEIIFKLSEVSVVQNYTLSVKAGRENFEQSVDIFMLSKPYSVFIQTDKPIYKPGDDVKFRVIAIDFNMKPYIVNSIIIEVRDSNGDVIRTFNEDKANIFSKGAYVGEFDIIDQPPLGIWDIRVTFSDDIYRSTIQYFEVKEHTEPRFEVHIETKSDVTTNSEILELTIYGLYSFGGFVNGTASITAKVFDSRFPGIAQKETVKALNVEFKKSIVFYIRKDLQIYYAIRPHFVELTTELEEHLTDYTIQLTREYKRFKPGFPYELRAIVRHSDGSILTAKFTPLEVKFTFIYSPKICSVKSEEFHLGRTYERQRHYYLKNGIADIKIDIPENTTALLINAEYKEASVQLNITRQLQKTKSEQFLKIIRTSSARAKIGKKISFEIDTNEVFDRDIFSVLIGRSGIIQHTTHVSYDYKINLDILVTAQMAPVSYLVVYFIYYFGEVVYDQIEIDVEPTIANQLDIKLSYEKVRPGQKMFKVGVKTTPNSFVSLLGVDSASQGFGNDIDKSRVIEDFAAYNANKLFSELVIKGSPPVDRYNEFGESNAFLITNAIDSHFECQSPALCCLELVLELEDHGVIESELPEPDKQKRRKPFRDNWIFSDFEADGDGKYSINPPIPDLINSFVLSGFSIHPEAGFAMAVNKKVTVRQGFSLKVFLPYSVKIGEVLKVDIHVFNYITGPKRSINVELFNTENEFQFVDCAAPGNSSEVAESELKFQNKSVQVKHGTGAKIYFLVRATVTGQIKIKVRASSASRSDEIERNILVVHDGRTHSGNKAFIIDLRKKDRESLSFNLPIVSSLHSDGSMNLDSVSIEASAFGDLMAPVIANIHNLIRMHAVSTEQQFSSLTSNIYAVRYLVSIGKMTDDFQKQSERFLYTGYQQLLARKQNDGSFSVWGGTDKISVWLTAYGGKLLTHAKKLININEQYLDDALSYVKSRQEADGSFNEDVPTISYMKPKTPVGFHLTAFVVIAFLEQDKLYRAKYSEVIEKALNFLDSKLPLLNDNSSMAIAAYAFALIGHRSTQDVLDQLKTNAIMMDDKMFWDFQGSSSPSVMVETAAYAIMAFVTAKRPSDAVQIMNWLVTQRNEAGGFYVSTDTAVGVQALTMMATEFNNADVNVTIRLSYENQENVEFKVNSSYAMDVQSAELKNDARIISMTAHGSGFAFFQVSYRYTTVLQDPVKRFDLTTEVLATGNENILHLKICASFIPEGEKVKSQMTLIEVNLPSGYMYDSQTAEMVKAVGVRSVQTDKGKTLIILYFDEITTTKVCPEVKAIRQTHVTQLKSALVKIFEYYDQGSRASTFYHPSSEDDYGNRT